MLFEHGSGSGEEPISGHPDVANGDDDAYHRLDIGDFRLSTIEPV